MSMCSGGGIAILFLCSWKITGAGDRFVTDGLPNCCQFGMIWAIWEPRSFIEHNFQTAAQVFINSEGFIDVAVLCIRSSWDCMLRTSLTPFGNQHVRKLIQDLPRMRSGKFGRSTRQLWCGGTRLHRPRDKVRAPQLCDRSQGSLSGI